MKQKTSLLALAEVFLPSLPENQEMRERVWQNFLYFLRDLDQTSQKKIWLLLRVLPLLSMLLTGRGHHKLNLLRRERLVERLFSFPAPIIAGLTGLKSLIYLSYYSEETTWPQIHYQGPIVQRQLQSEGGK